MMLHAEGLTPDESDFCLKRAEIPQPFEAVQGVLHHPQLHVAGRLLDALGNANELSGIDGHGGTRV
jgi:hypothetical protein